VPSAPERAPAPFIPFIPGGPVSPHFGSDGNTMRTRAGVPDVALPESHLPAV
jgi:hypothetical protein